MKVMPLQVSRGLFVGQVEATNAILRFAHNNAGPVSRGQVLTIEECRWDVAGKVVQCVRVAEWQSAPVAAAKRKRTSLLA
jgi:hypothetical protein